MANKPGRLATREAWGHHPLHASHHLRHSALLHFLHHALHVVELFQKTVNVLHLHTATGSNTAFTRTFDDFWLSALFHRHRVDDGFHTHQHFIVHLRSEERRVGKDAQFRR